MSKEKREIEDCQDLKEGQGLKENRAFRVPLVHLALLVLQGCRAPPVQKVLKDLLDRQVQRAKLVILAYQDLLGLQEK